MNYLMSQPFASATVRICIMRFGYNTFKKKNYFSQQQKNHLGFFFFYGWSLIPYIKQRILSFTVFPAPRTDYWIRNRLKNRILGYWAARVSPLNLAVYYEFMRATVTRCSLQTGFKLSVSKKLIFDWDPMIYEQS